MSPTISPAPSQAPQRLRHRRSARRLTTGQLADFRSAIQGISDDSCFQRSRCPTGGEALNSTLRSSTTFSNISTKPSSFAKRFRSAAAAESAYVAGRLVASMDSTRARSSRGLNGLLMYSSAPSARPCSTSAC